MKVTDSKISGRGYEEFVKANNRGYFGNARTTHPNRIILQMGNQTYTYKIGRVAKVDPETMARIGPSRKLEEVIAGNIWSVELMP